MVVVEDEDERREQGEERAGRGENRERREQGEGLTKEGRGKRTGIQQNR